MPGGLVHLMAYGAQNVYLNGNPTMTPFKSTYKRSTHFAMESIHLGFDYAPKQLPLDGGLTLKCRIDRNADLLHDSYLVIPLPAIYSPMRTNEKTSQAMPYEFQWVPHLGFNIIERAALIINGIKIVEHTGEWMKLHAQMDYEKAKREESDFMVGHRAALVDPANAFKRFMQYPHAIQPGPIQTGETLSIEPSIQATQIVVPLGFFFCETEGQALPLISLQSATVDIQITFQSLSECYTIKEVRPDNSLFGQRVKPLPEVPEHAISNFLSEPNVNGFPTNPSACWFFEPYIEANYIYLSEDERRQLATQQDLAYLLKDVRLMEWTDLYANAVLDLEAFNLVTRIVWLAQRNHILSDANGFDNYTNWDDPFVRPVADSSTNISTFQNFTLNYSSGYVAPNSDPNIIQRATFMVNGKERLTEKAGSYYQWIQHYRHNRSMPELPGVYSYSFALNNYTFQPSGAMNASMFDSMQLRLMLQTPPLLVDKRVVPTRTMQYMTYDIDPVTLERKPAQIVCRNPTASDSKHKRPIPVVNNMVHPSGAFAWAYNVRVYIESYNILRFASGTAALAFAR